MNIMRSEFEKHLIKKRIKFEWCEYGNKYTTKRIHDMWESFQAGWVALRESL